MKLLDCGEWTHIVKINKYKKQNAWQVGTISIEKQYHIRGHMSIKDAPFLCEIAHIKHGQVIWSSENYPWSAWVFGGQ